MSKEVTQKYTGWQEQPACDFKLARGASCGYSQEPTVCLKTKTVEICLGLDGHDVLLKVVNCVGLDSSVFIAFHSEVMVTIMFTYVICKQSGFVPCFSLICHNKP